MMTTNFSQPSKGRLTFPKPHTEEGMERINSATSHTTLLIKSSTNAERKEIIMVLHFRYKYWLQEYLCVFLDDCYIIVKKIGEPIKSVVSTVRHRIKSTSEWTGKNFQK